MSKAKKNMYSERYYSLTEDEMQAIILKAQAGDDASVQKLLDIFGNFLSKYVNMLFYNKYSMKDYDVRQFIALFMLDPEARRRVIRNQLNIRAIKHANESINGIIYMIQRYGDLEDIQQTVNMTFIQAMTRYERRGSIPFSGYLYSYYFYLLKKNIDTYLIDQLGRKTFPLITDGDMNDDWDSGEKTPGFMEDAEPAADEFLFTEQIDELWVSGETAQSPFDILTVQERQLLKWRYINGDRSGQISNRTTEHPNTIREHFTRIKQKLQEEVQRLQEAEDEQL